LAEASTNVEELATEYEEQAAAEEACLIDDT
jgi:hypothetical protein